jgi:hypothetical protein
MPLTPVLGYPSAQSRDRITRQFLWFGLNLPHGVLPCLFDCCFRERDHAWVSHDSCPSGADPDPDQGSGAFLTPGSGMGKKSRSGSEMRTNFWVTKIQKFFDADADQDPGFFLTLDPGWKKFGSTINIPDLQQWFSYIYFWLPKHMY